MKQKSKSNRLAYETSPYLLQHASNPVDWYPWGSEALNRAQSEDKPIILSIGYSACHWCHVMERETFENETVAEEMNRNYVCIKVDREERPDVDHIYMDAIHAMGIQGGWPLNIFLTPDQQPFYGGTYFPPQQWSALIQKVNHAFHENRTQLETSAGSFTEALSKSQTAFQRLPSEMKLPVRADIESTFEKLSQNFDVKLGGNQGAPKFPMPVEWNFCIEYFKLTNDQKALDQVNLTLVSMARGGIYDQVGGGFSRYSVDDKWFAPHFEKMLYDNGQLVSLFSAAYQVSPNPLYASVVEETVNFIKGELTSPEGGFYSALDADSEGTEGKYYIWDHAEAKEVIGSDFEIFEQYYNLLTDGNWENGHNILHTNQDPQEFSQIMGIDEAYFQNKLNQVKKRLFEVRASRVKPGLDDKILSGWNGMMISGLCDAYAIFGQEEYLQLAVNNAIFIKQKMISDQGLYRSYKNDEAKIPGYLEDLGSVSLGFTSLYQLTFDEQWLNSAVTLIDAALAQFYDPEDGFFFFTGAQSEKLIAQKKELFDNVIPSSNSIIAQVLLHLGIITENSHYSEIAQSMISKMANLVREHPGSFANWASLMTQIVSPPHEIAIVGPNALTLLRQLRSKVQAQAVFLGTTSTSKLPLLEDKKVEKDETLIFVCQNRTCKLPVASVEEALLQIS